MAKKETKKIKIDENVSINRIVDNLLNYAIVQEAGSILFEPKEDNFSVSFSFYGKFKEVVNLAKKLELGVVRKIKEIAGLDGEESSLPQLGEFKAGLAGTRVIFSVSTRPVSKGEKIIIDISRERSRLFYLKQLGLQKKAFWVVKRTLEKLTGGIIVIGDFDSGKTTTLYSFLNFINNSEINISTIEKEINHDLPFINQSLLNIKGGFDYPLALPCLLRQDPDIIMIDEIDNREAAENFLHIAERGHLVLASIYGKDISTCLNFFKELEIPLPLFAKTVKVIVNQRLIKRICPHCVTRHKLNRETIRKIKENFNVVSLIKKAQEEKVISASIRKLEDLSFYKSKGCSRCNKTGFIGRIGVYEVLEMTEETRELIKGGHLAKVAGGIEKGSRFFLAEDAFLKAACGVTSINEALKIAGNK